MNRIVTGYDENGSPAVIRQGEPPTVIRAGRYVTTELWVTDAAPLRATGADTSTRAWQLEPPSGGSCFRIVEIVPAGEAGVADGDGGGPAGAGSAADGGGPAGDGGQDDATEGFQDAHATDTLDYVTVLRGEVVLVVGQSEITLGPGDSVVQQPGVPHDWQNRSAERAIMVGVLLSAG